MLDQYDGYPKGPDPSFEGAVFLGWLKKRGAMVRAKDCELKCQIGRAHV